MFNLYGEFNTINLNLKSHSNFVWGMAAGHPGYGENCIFHMMLLLS